MLAIARKAFPQIGQPCIDPMLVNQSGKADAALAIAPVAGDLQHGQLALQLAERNRAAVAHSGNPKPASAATISISHSFSTSRRACGSPNIALFQIRQARSG